MPPRKKKQEFIRNTRYVPIGMRLGSGRRIDLQPRGMRGDTAPVSEDEMNDEVFLGNLDVLFEVISDTDAKDVIKKQTTNQQKVHPALHHLRNERGEQYDKGVVVQEQEEAHGYNVGAIDERGMITRFKAPGTSDYDLPEIPSYVPPEEHADWLARNSTQIEGPEAGLGGLRVVKEENPNPPTSGDK